MVDNMSDVDFNEPQYVRSSPRSGQPSLLSRMVQKIGLARTDAGAQKILAILAVIIAVIAIGVYLLYGRS